MGHANESLKAYIYTDLDMNLGMERCLCYTDVMIQLNGFVSELVSSLVAERLNARLLILLRISFCVGMYVRPSNLGMLISVHCARALVLPARLALCVHARGIIAFLVYIIYSSG